MEESHWLRKPLILGTNSGEVVWKQNQSLCISCSHFWQACFWQANVSQCVFPIATCSCPKLSATHSFLLSGKNGEHMYIKVVSWCCFTWPKDCYSSRVADISWPPHHSSSSIMVLRWSTFQCFASFHIQLLSTSPETARVARNCESHSFIIRVCLGVQHLKLIWHWNAKPAKPASWRNSNGNRFVWWAFCAPWTWKQTECFPLTFLGHHIMLLAKLAPISSYPALIRCRSVACFRGPNFSIHYIPSGIPVLCWTHANGVSVINFLIFNVSHLFTFNSCLLLLKVREWPETAKVIHLSFVYALVSNI